jgi:hypothetical protein
VELLTDVMEHIFDDEVKFIELLSSKGFVGFFVKLQVVEPKWRVFDVELQALITDLNGF